MMNKEIKEQLINIVNNTILIIKDVRDVNHKPHVYMIGRKHVTYASEHYSGMLGQETLDNVACAVPNCNLSYDQHTSDKVLFLQLKKNVKNKQFQKEIVKFNEHFKTNKYVDGICFVETEEKFRIIND